MARQENKVSVLTVSSPVLSRLPRNILKPLVQDDRYCSFKCVSWGLEIFGQKQVRFALRCRGPLLVQNFINTCFRVIAPQRAAFGTAWIFQSLLSAFKTRCVVVVRLIEGLQWRYLPSGLSKYQISVPKFCQAGQTRCNICPLEPSPVTSVHMREMSRCDHIRHSCHFTASRV